VMLSLALLLSISSDFQSVSEGKFVGKLDER
jgi:hypothetical protein